MSLPFKAQPQHYRARFSENLSLSGYSPDAKFSTAVKLQVTPGHFSGCTSHVLFRHGLQTRSVANQTIYYQGSTHCDTHMIVGYIEPGCHIFLNGQKVFGDQSFIIKPHLQYDLLIPQNTPLSLSAINLPSLCSNLQQIRSAHNLDSGDFLMIENNQTLSKTLFHFGQQNSVPDAAKLNQAAHNALKSSKELEVRANNRGGLFSKAVRLITSKPFAIKKVSDLANEVCTSQRSLEKAFSATGLSPREFLRTCQLNYFRDSVHQLHSDGDTLANIANKIGVSNYSRLSKDYKSFFGELPTQTRRLAL